MHEATKTVGGGNISTPEDTYIDAYMEQFHPHLGRLRSGFFERKNAFKEDRTPGNSARYFFACALMLLAAIPGRMALEDAGVHYRVHVIQARAAATVHASHPAASSVTQEQRIIALERQVRELQEKLADLT